MFNYDERHRERDPNLATFIFKPGNLIAVYDTPTGRAIEATLVSRYSAAALRGAISAAPTKPPMPAIEHILSVDVGEVAFVDDSKKLIGRLIRQIVEHLGGEHTGRGTPLAVASKFSKGSTYTLPPFTRRLKK